MSNILKHPLSRVVGQMDNRKDKVKEADILNYQNIESLKDRRSVERLARVKDFRQVCDDETEYVGGLKSKGRKGKKINDIAKPSFFKSLAEKKKQYRTNTERMQNLDFYPIQTRQFKEDVEEIQNTLIEKKEISETINQLMKDYPDAKIKPLSRPWEPAPPMPPLPHAPVFVVNQKKSGNDSDTDDYLDLDELEQDRRMKFYKKNKERLEFKKKLQEELKDNDEKVLEFNNRARSKYDDSKNGEYEQRYDAVNVMINNRKEDQIFEHRDNHKRASLNVNQKMLDSVDRNYNARVKQFQHRKENKILTDKEIKEQEIKIYETIHSNAVYQGVPSYIQSAEQLRQGDMIADMATKTKSALEEMHNINPDLRHRFPSPQDIQIQSRNQAIEKYGVYAHC